MAAYNLLSTAASYSAILEYFIARFLFSSFLTRESPLSPKYLSFLVLSFYTTIFFSYSASFQGVVDGTANAIIPKQYNQFYFFLNKNLLSKILIV
jgi:hypothetical protein